MMTSYICMTSQKQEVDLGKFCGKEVPEVTPLSNEVLIKFYSDSSLCWLPYMGFKVDITGVYDDTDTDITGHPCSLEGATVTGSGQIDFPPGDGKYSNNIKCHWRIIVRDNMRVHLTFSYGDFAGECAVGVTDVLPSGNEVSIGAFGENCGAGAFAEYTSTSNQLIITFRSGFNHQYLIETGKGFIADITEIAGADSQSGGQDEHHDEPVEPSGMCGMSVNPPRAKRIVGGFEAGRHSFPWQVQLHHNYFDRYRCSGSIISEHWVITAAHCVVGESPSDYTVIAGADDLGLDANEETRQTRSISEIIIHEDYEDRGPDFPLPQVNPRYLNDIALLRLSSELWFSQATMPVCLPRYREQVQNDKLCIATGWGKTGENWNYPDKLMQVSIPVTSCIDSFIAADTESQLCAGFEQGGKGICVEYHPMHGHGDSGGPLVCSQSEAFILQGISSHSYGCKRMPYPGVFTRTSHYIDWITWNTGGEFHFINDDKY